MKLRSFLLDFRSFTPSRNRISEMAPKAIRKPGRQGAWEGNRHVRPRFAPGHPKGGGESFEAGKASPAGRKKKPQADGKGGVGLRNRAFCPDARPIALER